LKLVAKDPNSGLEAITLPKTDYYTDSLAYVVKNEGDTYTDIEASEIAAKLAANETVQAKVILKATPRTFGDNPNTAEVEDDYPLGGNLSNDSYSPATTNRVTPISANTQVTTPDVGVTVYYTIVPETTLTIDAIADQTYTGSALAPAITVKNSAGAIVDPANYDVAFSNNINLGTATVAVTGKGYVYSQATGSTTFKIKEPTSQAPVAGNEVAGTAKPVAPGSPTLLPPTYKFADGTAADVTWTSSNDSVAKIVDGKLVGTGEGKVNITATSLGGKTETLTITIAKPVTAVRTALSSITLAKGKTITLPVVADSVNASGKAETVAKLEWTTSNSKVATVSASGKIKAVKAGKAVITATALNGKKLSVKVKVVAKSKAVTKVSIKAPGSLKKGKSAVLSVKLSPASATAQLVKFKSSKPSVLKVDKAGRITALKKGKAKITVTVGKKKVTRQIKVK
jgi:uncharacterized protein YjdB